MVVRLLVVLWLLGCRCCCECESDRLSTGLMHLFYFFFTYFIRPLQEVCGSCKSSATHFCRCVQEVHVSIQCMAAGVGALGCVCTC